jgi:predicted transposase YbfD/YdcC
MVILPCRDKETTFFEELSQLPNLDERDNRGKRHDLSLVLLGFTLALLSKRDGCLSSIHRHMKRHYAATCVFVGRSVEQVVSRSQLPLVLSKVNVVVLDALIFRFYGIELSDTEKQWFSGDGKDLKGSIVSGDSRGVAVVQLVSHQSGTALHSLFYDGCKESEKPTIRTILEQSGALGQKISLDALHFSPQTLSLIHQSQGQYLISLKKNQKELLAHMRKVATHLPVQYSLKTVDKGHGRVDTRHYEVFDIKKNNLINALKTLA